MTRVRADLPIRWRSRPLLAAAAMVAGGILLQWHFRFGSAGIWAGILAAALMAAGAIAAVPRRRLVSLRPLCITMCTVVALTALGGLRLSIWEGSSTAPLVEIAKEVDGYEHAFPLMITGRVRGSATATARRLAFHIEADSIGFDQLVPTSGRVAVTIWSPREFGNPSLDSEELVDWPELSPGQRIAIEGLLAPLPRRRNPADFDYGAYLYRQGIHAVLSSFGPDALIVREHRATLHERVLTISRRHVRSALQTHVSDQDARAVLEALLLADRSGIDPTIRRGFARTGIAHLLAVSGLHVFLVGMVLYGLLKPLLHRFGWPWRRVELARAAITLLLLGAYVSVVGGPASAVRALIMAAALIAGRAFERPANALNSLGSAALILLLVRPVGILDAGFQLSFAAVGALVVLMPQLERMVPVGVRENSVADYVSRLVLASIAATVGTAPVLMAHFGIFPVAGVALNVIAIPATAMALGAGLLTVLFHGYLGSLADAAGESANLFARVVLETGIHGERWLGWSTVDLYITDLLTLGALALLILSFSFLGRHRLWWRTITLSCFVFAAAAWSPILQREHRSNLELLFFDVGQGDAALISLPNGKTLLVDAGPRDPYGDTGTRTILPHLDRFRIHRLDAIIVTHPHSDHLGGVPALLQEVPVDTLYDNGDAFDSDLYRETLATARIHGVPIRGLQAGDELDLDPQVVIQVLHPGIEPDAHPNDASVVLRIVYGEVSFILAGDVEIEAETTIAARYGEALCTDMIKVPHHGSRTSSTEPFVDAVAGCGRTRFAVVPVARRNRYALPNAEALDRWKGSGASVLKTGQEGALWFRSDGRDVWQHAWR